MSGAAKPPAEAGVTAMEAAVASPQAKAFIALV
jgi:hypothetical protein